VITALDGVSLDIGTASSWRWWAGSQRQDAMLDMLGLLLRPTRAIDHRWHRTHTSATGTLRPAPKIGFCLPGVHLLPSLNVLEKR